MRRPGYSMTPEALSAIHKAAFPERPWSPQTIEGFVNRPGVHLFEAEQGFLLVQALRPEAEILTLAVHPDMRRRGVGKGLVEGLIIWAGQARMERIVLEVATDNDPARALYAKLGFCEIGRRKGYYKRKGGTAVDAVIMARAVTQSQAGHDSARTRIG